MLETQRKTLNVAIGQILGRVISPPPMKLDEWSDENFYLSPESSAATGQWRTLPYQRAIMRAISNDDVERVSWQKSARTGYTKIICAAICYFAEHRRRSQVVYQPTDDDAKDFVRDEVNPSLRDVKVVRAICRADPEKRSKFMTTAKKMFMGSTLDIKGGTSPRNYRRMTKDVVYYDELDGFDQDIQGEGSPLLLGDKRVANSLYAKSVRGSTPNIAGESHIEDCMQDADYIFHRCLPCPNCGSYRPLVWEQFKWTPKQPMTAHHVCKDCDHKMEYSDLADLDAKGEWRTCPDVDHNGAWRDTRDMPEEALRVFRIDEELDRIIDEDGKVVEWPFHVAFHLWQGYSYFYPWHKMIREHESAYRKIESDGDDTSMKTFWNTALGRTYEVHYGPKVTWQQLMQRRQYYPMNEHEEMLVPNDVVMVTVGIDGQDDRFEMEFVGWCRGEESYSLGYEVVWGDPSKQIVWDMLYERISTKKFVKRNGQQLELKRGIFDSGGHYTDEVYHFCLKYGAGSTWIMPSKGWSTAGKPVATVPLRPNDKGVLLIMIGTESAKELIYQRNALIEPGPGYAHYPMDDVYGERYFKGMTCEKKIRRIEKGQSVTRWENPSHARNEPLDCRVMNLAALRVEQFYSGQNILQRLHETLVENPQDSGEKQKGPQPVSIDAPR